MSDLQKHAKKFLYLIQCSDQLPDSYASIAGEHADIILLSWKEQVEGAIYFPGSTWTQGRNRLLQEAKAKETSYLYYIFLDDDILFEKGSWRVFEEALLKYKPAVATPYYPEFATASVLSDLALEAHSCLYFDAMFNAFHRDVVRGNLVLPYYAAFDEKSWWYSQWFVMQLTYLFFRQHTLQINTVWIHNTKHSTYPQDDDFKAVQNWFEKEVLKPRLLRFVPHQFFLKATRRLLPLETLGRTLWKPRKPARKKTSYRVPLIRKKRKLNMKSAFWQK